MSPVETKFIKASWSDRQLSLPSLDEISAARRTLPDVRKELRRLGGAQAGRLNTKQEEALQSLKAFLAPTAYCQLAGLKSGWEREAARLLEEDERLLERLTDEVSITSLDRQRLRQMQWRNGLSFEAQTASTDFTFHAGPSDETTDHGLVGLERIARAMAVSMVGPGVQLLDVEIQLAQSRHAHNGGTEHCLTSILEARGYPRLLAIKFEITRPGDNSRTLCIQLRMRILPGVLPVRLTKEWSKGPHGFAHRFATAIGVRARRTPWYSIEELVNALTRRTEKPETILEQVAYYGEQISREHRLCTLLYRELPHLVENSPRNAVRSHLFVILRMLKQEPAFDATTRVQILKALLRRNRLSEGEPQFDTDSFLVDAAELMCLLGEDQDLAKSIVVFFREHFWNHDLSSCVRELLAKKGGASSTALSEACESALVRAGSECLHRAFLSGRLEETIKPLGCLIRSPQLSANVRQALFDRVRHTVTSLLPSAAPNTWVTATDLGPFFAAWHLCSWLPEREECLENLKKWTRWLPRLNGKDPPLRYPASLLLVIKEWMRRLPAGAAPRIPCFCDIVAWLLQWRAECIELSANWTGPQSFADAFHDLLLSEAEWSQVRLYALQIILAQIEKAESVDRCGEVLLGWLRDDRKDLLNTAGAVAALAPWKLPALRFAWQEWFLHTWADSVTTQADNLLSLVLQAILVDASQRSSWIDLLRVRPLHTISTESQKLVCVEPLVLAAGKCATLSWSEIEFILEAIADWTKTKERFNHLKSIANLTPGAASVSEEHRVRLLLGGLPLPGVLLGSRLVEFFLRYPTLADVVTLQPPAQDVLKELFKNAPEEAWQVGGLLVARLMESKDPPSQIWERALGMRMKLGRAASDWMPSLYRQLAPVLLPDWIRTSQLAQLRDFVQEVGYALAPIGEPLGVSVAGAVLNESVKDWHQLHDQGRTLLQVLELLRLCPPNLRSDVECLFAGPPLPTEPARQILIALLATPSGVRRRMARDLAWQAASELRLTDPTAAEWFSRFGLS